MNAKKTTFLHGLAAMALTACLLASTGCGPSKGTLKGKVTLDGVALKGGQVNFFNKTAGGRGATVEINEDGTYSIPLIFGGDYTISVDTEYLKPKSGPNMGPNSGSMPKGMGMPKGAGMSPPGSKVNIPKDIEKDYAKHDVPQGYVMANPNDNLKKYVKLPSKYADDKQSGLTYTHAGGDQTHDIALVGGGK